MLPDERGISILRSLQFVAFGGGLLKPSVGDRLEKSGVKLLNHYGATETGPLAPVFVPTSDYDWRYFRLRDDIRETLEVRLDRRPSSEDTVPRFTLSLRPPGWTERFEVQDVLIGNPRKPGSDFNAVGRNDDLIILATGEKVIPRILESSLSQSELVKAAVAFGDGQFEIGVLVEPIAKLAPNEIENFKSAIWPIVQEANRQMDAHGWIWSRHAVVVVEPNAIPRADKGTLLRREALKALNSEITQAYSNLDASVESVTPLEMQNLERGIKELIQNHLYWKYSDREWDEGHDFFELGMDSLQAVRLHRLLLASLPREIDSPETRSKVGRGFVYQYPSVTKISYALRNLDNWDELANGYQSIDQLVQQYALQPRIGSENAIGYTVLLTGSTGSLGAYVLASLAKLPNVKKIICINRPSEQDAYERHKEACERRGLSLPQDMWAKLHIYQTNAAAHKLGLEDDEYTSILNQVTHIVHNAWPMDFKLLLPSFTAQFRILQNVLCLARAINTLHPKSKPRVIFVSSIAVVGHYHDRHGEQMVPEVPSLPDDTTMEMGYAKAKLVCERIIEHAAREYPNEFEVGCVRLGQIAGAQSTGYWNSNEHVAALVKSSEKIRKLPLLQGV